MRRDLGDWLEARGVDDLTSRDVVLAASEAVANAAEHGAGRRPANRVHVQVQVEDAQTVVVQVKDSGRWRSPVSSPERGRGLQIIEVLMDDVAISSDRGTTVVLRRALKREAS
jgi:anti-sigma regulatory factor (Ser/Thr protein kinase)